MPGYVLEDVPKGVPVRIRTQYGDALSGMDADHVEYLVLGDENIRVRQRLDGAQCQ